MHTLKRKTLALFCLAAALVAAPIVARIAKQRADAEKSTAAQAAAAAEKSMAEHAAAAADKSTAEQATAAAWIQRHFDEEPVQAIDCAAVAPAARMTIAEMIARGKYDSVDPSIVQMYPNVDPTRFSLQGLKVFRFAPEISSAEVVAAMAREGYEPATIEGLLALGMHHPKLQIKYGEIYALGSRQWSANNELHVPMLIGGNSEYPDERDLTVSGSIGDIGWPINSAFLGRRVAGNKPSIATSSYAP